MKNARQVKSLLLIVIVSLWVSINQPLKASIFHPLESSPAATPLNQLTTSISDVADTLRRPRVPGGSRGDTEETAVCGIVPGKLFDPAINDESTIKIWNLNPIFVWQEDWTRLDVVEFRTNETVASAELTSGQRTLTYGEIDNAQPLEPGTNYYWRLANAETSARISFRMMTEAERAEIEVELNTQLQSVENSPEVILTARIEFFVEKQLWADAFREIYAVSNPSEKIQSLIAGIESTNYCENDSFPVAQPT